MLFGWRSLFVLTIIFIFVVAFAVYVFQKGRFPIDVLRLEIIGPSGAETMEEIEYAVIYKNKGEVVLEEAVLHFEYPEGALPSDGNTRIIERELGDLIPGEEDTVHFRGKLLGKEGETKTARASLRFRPRGLRAFFETTNSLTTVLKTAPFALDIDLPPRIEARDLHFSIHYQSLSRHPLTNLNLKVEYPVGFNYENAAPTGLTPDEWRIGILNKGEGGRVDIKGKIRAEPLEQKTFRAQILVFNEIEQKQVVLKEVSKVVEIVNPSIFLSQWANGQRDYIANPGEELHIELFFRNSSEAVQQNLLLFVQLDTDMIDISSVRSPQGDWRQESKMLFWDGRTVRELRILEPFKEGKVEFFAKVRDSFAQGEILPRNALIRSRVTIGNEREEFRISVNTKVEVSQQVFYSYEGISQSGPSPPVVGVPTAYTVVWEIKNFFNNLRGVQVKSILPSWASVASGIEFREDTREVVWVPGVIPAGVGAHSAGSGQGDPLRTSFQISVTPPIESVGSPLLIIGPAILEGEDDFTRTFIRQEAEGVDSTLPHDAQYGGVVRLSL